MRTKTKISLNVPGSNKQDQYFSFYLKQEIQTERTEYQQPKRMLVVSDSMTGFQNFCKLLFKHGVIDKFLNWVYGDGSVVILSNCVKYNDHLIEWLWFIYSLEESAGRQGGNVHFLVNNQVNVLLNDVNWRYIHPNYAVKKPGAKNPTNALYYGNSELWHWLSTKNCIIKIGVHLFVNSSNTLAELNTLSCTLREVNQIICSQPPQSHSVFSLDDEQEVDGSLTKFSVSTIITGHGGENQLTSHFNGKLIIVDKDVLLVKRKHLYHISTDKQKKRIK